MRNPETTWLIVAGLLGLAVVFFVAYLIVSTARSRPDRGGKHRAPNKKRPHRDTFRTEDPEPEPKKRAAIIADALPATLRSELTSQSIVAGWDEPLWLDVGDRAAAAAAARTALDADVDVVCVRGDAVLQRGAVSVLVGTETPVAFLPLPTQPPRDVHGTGVERPSLADDAALAAAMKTALTGQNSRIDVGRATLAAEELTGAPEEPPEPVSRELVFLTSIVFGDIVPDDEPALSAKVVTKSLFSGTSFTAIVKPDDEEAVTRPLRSIAFLTRPTTTAGEEGRDRQLDAYLHAAQSVKGWAGVARAMMRKSSRATPLLIPLQSVAFTVTTDKPTEITVDGQSIGFGNPGESTVRVDPLALVVRR